MVKRTGKSRKQHIPYVHVWIIFSVVVMAAYTEVRGILTSFYSNQIIRSRQPGRFSTWLFFFNDEDKYYEQKIIGIWD